MATDVAGGGNDVVAAAKALRKEHKDAASELFIAIDQKMQDVEPALRQGAASDGYATALLTVINCVVTTEAFIKAPGASLQAGFSQQPGGRRYLERKLKNLSFRNRTGVDLEFFKRLEPEPVELLQQIALGAAATADKSLLAGHRREVVVDLLEDAFYPVASRHTMDRYQAALVQWKVDVQRLQFCIMRMLCILYRELLAADRMQNIKYLFRHAEAAGIMTMTEVEHYAGYAESAWNAIQKITLGVMFVNQQVWDTGRDNAHRAVYMAAKAGHDFAFVPAGWSLVFFIAVGMPGSDCDWPEVHKLVADLRSREDALARWGLCDKVVFDLPPRQWWIAIVGEHKQAQNALESSKAGKKGGKKRGASKAKDGAGVDGKVTDWRVLDQRFLGYYTWFEPPMQKEQVKCAMCGLTCYKIHRCPRCKLVPYCRSTCEAADMFDHECDTAPRPWLAPPCGPPQKPPKELGEEGFLGFIPWDFVRYAMLCALCYALVWALKRFEDFREQEKLGVLDCLLLLFERLWQAVHDTLFPPHQSRIPKPMKRQQLLDHWLQQPDQRQQALADLAEL